MSVGQAIDTQTSPKLSQVLFREPTRNFATIAPLPSNVQAIESALLFATGMTPLLALVGPSGWGKSHLLEASAHRLGMDGGAAPQIWSALEWANFGPRAECHGPLILDNAQDALDSGRAGTNLRIALERRVKASKPTCLSFTSAKPTRQLRAFLPHSRRWTIAQINAPDPAEKVLVIDQMASAEGLRLSSILVKLIAYRMKGNGRTLSGALKRLRLSGAVWTEGRQILRGCGVLDCFLTDNSGWDLHERILNVARAEEFRDGAFRTSELAAHLMLRVAGLSEDSVAQRLALPHAEVYALSSKFERLLTSAEATRQIERRAIERILEGLSSD